MKVAILAVSHVRDETFVDPRTSKEADALVRAGHQVVILGTGKEGKDLPKHEVKDGVIIIRQVTILQRLYNWLVKGSPTPGLQGDKALLSLRENGSTNFVSKLLIRFSMLRHNLNVWLFYLTVIPEAVRQNADVYVGYDLPGLRPAYLAARLTGARLVYDSAELWTERVRGIPYRRLQKMLVAWQEKTLCRRCDLVVTMSHSVARILGERYSIPKPLVVLNVHPYVETMFSPEIHAQLTGGANQRVVIYVGFLDYGKGLKQLVDAAQYLEGVTIAIVGDGVLRPVLESKVKEKGLEDRVRFVGWVTRDEVPVYVASADAGVSPIEGKWLNYYHNLDNKVFDYIMAGIPLAVSNQPEKRHLVEEYGIGVTFDETDPRDIARAISSLFSDPVEYETMRANCRKAAREKFNWEVVSQRYVSAVEKLIER